MAWKNIMVNVVYEDNSPVENARVFYRLTDGATVPPQSGYTDSDGHLKIISDQTTNVTQTIDISVFDETLFLENRYNTFTIHDGDVYTLMLNCDNVGITFNFNVGITDILRMEVCNKPVFQPTYYSGYTKDANGNYNLYMHEYTDKVQINKRRFETTEFKFSAATPSNVQLNEPYITFTVPYTYNLYDTFNSIEHPVLLKNYSVKIQNINDTINWNDQSLSLINCEMTFYGNTSANTLISSSQTISSLYGYIDIDTNNYSTSDYTGRRFDLLFNPLYNEIKVTKNHYIENISNCFISGDSSGNLFLLKQDCTETDPIIIEREPNVCMTNQDLCDYVISLVGFIPDLPVEYESNKVGVSDTGFTYLWSESIKRYLSPEYQTITPDTVEDFKTVFVNQLYTTRVLTLYTNPSSIENNYTLDKHHGYVWDRCFIPKEKEFVENCLTFSILPNNVCSISFNYMPGPRTLFDFEYSLNGGNTWNAYSFGQDGIGQTITLSPGGNTSIKFRRALSNTGTTLSSGYYYYYYFAMTGTCTSSGNITSLLDGYGLSTTELDSNYCFIYLFKNCTGLRNSPELPETTLTEGCFFGMFSNCTSLLDGPETLPIETLADYCYTNMFAGCTSLTTAPQLPATTLADYCYANMFQGCTSLTTTPVLQKTALRQYCYYGMFSACTSLTTILGLPSTVLADYCYANMFQGCTSLTTAPQLPATTMALGCYEYMFGSCSSLTNARTLSAATDLTESCFEGMFDSCTSLVTAPIISSGLVMKKNCFKKMFYGCSRLATMPYTGNLFPWQSHAYGCYESMFEGCTSLRTIPSSIFGYNARDYCFKRMFAGCTSITNPITLYANNLGTVSGACESMFEGCTSLISGRTADSLVIGPNCYKNMFKNCVNLICVVAKFTGTTSGNFTMQNASAYTYNWVSGVSGKGMFYHKNETPGAPGGYSVHWIPNGWGAQILV